MVIYYEKNNDCLESFNGYINSGLTYIGFNLTSKNKDFYVKENLIKEAAIEYFNHYPDKLPPKEAIVKRNLGKRRFLR